MPDLADRFSRPITYLRVSVTDRCNFRCVYCMPAEGVKTIPRADVLSFEEITRVVRVGVGLGLIKVRLTGGEPTVRADLPVLVRMLRDIPGLGEISMTTNAARLTELAEPLKAAGLDRVNVSLDTLNRDRAAALARRDVLPAVLAGIDAAVAARLTPLKLNAVVMGGVNDDELPDLVAYARGKGAEIRFIEYMPMGDARLDGQNRTVTAAEMRERLGGSFDLVRDAVGEGVQDAKPADAWSAAAPARDPHDPARGWVCRRTGARVGFITSISEHFCDTCNRMRLTAEGGLRPCLHQDAEVPVRDLLRSGGTDTQVADAFRQAAGLKWAGHRMTHFVPLFSRKEMVAIGG
jgi:cyclic pyranopterin phosphate synthase